MTIYFISVMLILHIHPQTSLKTYAIKIPQDRPFEYV